MGTQQRLLDDVRRIQLSLQLLIQLSVLENQLSSRNGESAFRREFVMVLRRIQFAREN
jgi:hypothetical protein